jgi:hypothetical protein
MRAKFFYIDEKGEYGVHDKKNFQQWSLPPGYKKCGKMYAPVKTKFLIHG